MFLPYFSKCNCCGRRFSFKEWLEIIQEIQKEIPKIIEENPTISKKEIVRLALREIHIKKQYDNRTLP